MRRTRLRATAITLGLLVAVLAAVAYGCRGYLTALLPYPADADVADLAVPAGFRIAVYAEGVENARQMALGPDGVVFVGSRSAGKVHAVVDRDGDGTADEVVVVASGLDMPSGVAFRDGALYVAEVSRVRKYAGINRGNLRAPPAPVAVGPAYPSDRHHGWKFIRFGPDGKLYVPVGAPCNVCDPRDPYGTITRFDPAGGALEIVARGVRNSVGFDWQPGTGELWFTDNGRDWLGDEQPPDELNRAPRAGLHFGFPACHGPGLRDPEHNRGQPCDRFTPPAQALGPHVAAIGMRFYTGRAFPERYRGGIFIAEHGSWNRSAPIGYRVTFVGLDGARAVSYEPFATGWLRGAVASGRPADVEVMPDGALLVSDDKGGRIYRITPDGPGAARRRG
jgi:glucose/arabinose dehydrogenase